MNERLYHALVLPQPRHTPTRSHRQIPKTDLSMPHLSLSQGATHCAAFTSSV